MCPEVSLKEERHALCLIFNPACWNVDLGLDLKFMKLVLCFRDTRRRQWAALHVLLWWWQLPERPLTVRPRAWNSSQTLLSKLGTWRKAGSVSSKETPVLANHLHTGGTPIALRPTLCHTISILFCVPASPTTCSKLCEGTVWRNTCLDGASLLWCTCSGVGMGHYSLSLQGWFGFACLQTVGRECVEWKPTVLWRRLSGVYRT